MRGSVSHSPVQVVLADRLFDGQGGVLNDAGVAFQGRIITAVGSRSELIAQVGDGAELHEFSGCTLLPGLIDTHTHLIMPGTGQAIFDYATTPDELMLLVAARNAERSLQAGVTTVVDLGAKGALTFHLRDAMRQGIVQGSRLVLCGRALTITGGHGWPWLGEADGVDGVRRAVRQLCKEGADLIKVMVTGGGTPGTDGRRPAYTVQELEAIVDEAHARGRKVIGHCTATTGIEWAINAGFDMIAHCQFLAPDGSHMFDDQLAKRIGARGIFINPTLQINRILSSDRVPRDHLDPTARASLDSWCDRYPTFVDHFRRLRAAGVRMVCGSDCGWGYSTFDETYLELDAMVEAGMTPSEALTSATANAADAIGWSDQIGCLAPGWIADLLVVMGDPTRDIKALREVRAVWLEGVRKESHTSRALPWSIEPYHR